MQEKTVSEERALVHGMLWNCQESGRQQRSPGTTSPFKKREPDPPRRPPASEHAAKRLCLGLATGH